MKYKSVNFLNPNSLEILCIDIFPTNDSKMRLILVYRPPNMNKSLTMEMFKILKQLICLKFIILGDLNFPNINWLGLSAPRGYYDRFCIEFLCKNALFQLVQNPTCNNNVLDIIITNNVSMVNNLRINFPFASSDHSSIEFFVPININFKHNSFKNYRKSNFNSISDDIHFTNWHILFQGSLDINNIWSLFHSVLINSINKHTPLTFIYPNKPFKIKISNKTKKLKIDKNKFWKIFNNNKNEINRTNYYDSVNKFKMSLLNDNPYIIIIYYQMFQIIMYGLYFIKRLVIKMNVICYIIMMRSLCLLDVLQKYLINILFQFLL